tara:strand:+ start:519 stop:1139 length:621 start_codon:yes stop_codon:yes gene_type:complete
MPEVQIEPTKEHPIPYDLTEEKPTTLMDEIAVAGNTAELQESLGAELDVSEGDTQREKELLDAVANAKKPSNLTNQSTAFAAATFLRTYGQQLAMDAVSARAAITNKLMELADCGDPRYELKALELLGKHSDIGIFTERSEITVNYSNPEDLEKAIKDRVKTLLNATVVDTIPLSQSLDEELGLLDDLDDDLDDEEDKDDESDISV